MEYSACIIKSKKSAFTLAEILITLGIIGVIAAVTLPTLIQNYKKLIVETRLKSFYTNINNAILLAKNEYGDIESWTLSDTDSFFDKYLKSYLKYNKIDYEMLKGYKWKKVYLTNGSHFIMLVKDPYILIDLYINDKKANPGGNKFSFAYCKNCPYHNAKFGIEPYKIWWDGNIQTLRKHTEYGCNIQNSERQYCTEIIYRNGWKIPNDYPFKF